MGETATLAPGCATFAPFQYPRRIEWWVRPANCETVAFSAANLSVSSADRVVGETTVTPQFVTEYPCFQYPRRIEWWVRQAQKKPVPNGTGSFSILGGSSGG